MTTDTDGSDHRHLVDKGNSNLRATTEKFAHHAPDGETTQFGPLIAAVSGTPIPVFNRILVFESPADDDLSEAVAWMAEHEVPFWVTVTEPVVDAVADRAAELNLTKTSQSEPGMVLSSLDEIPPNETATAIEVVTTSEGLGDFITVFSEVFDIPSKLTRQVHPDSLLTDDKIDVFVGRTDGRPVACGLLIQSDDVAGIYSIGVDEEYRRQGIGEAVTWEALRTGREAGCQIGVLQSSEMAYPLYEKMGFETVAHYYHFEPDT